MHLKLEKGNICQLINDIIQRFGPELHRAGNFINTNLEACDDLLLDHFRIEQVFSNLLSNIVKYAPRCEVLISTENLPDNQLKISVRDTGPGINPEDLEKIFHRFERVGEMNGPSGLGLGLFLSRQIVEAHGGKIWAESVPQKGTSFLILLPKNLNS